MPESLVDRFLRKGLRFALLVAGAQALVLTLGWYLVYETTHEQVSQSVEDVILSANVAAARGIVDALGGLSELDDYGGEAWEEAQDLIEGLELGGGGFACILDSDGHVMCHPEMRSDPGLRSVSLAAERLTPVEGGAGIALSELSGGGVQRGTIDLPFDGKHYIATYRDPQSGVQLLVHQPVSGLTAAGRQVTSALLARMLAVGGLLITSTFLLGVLLLRAHDRSLVRWNERLEERVERRTSELTRSHRAILIGLAKLSEYRDNETGLHVERMCAYSGALARELSRRGADLDAQWVQDLELAASLHDIGKVSIPDAILLKPGRLTPDEFAIMKGHAEAGEATLRAVRDELDDTRLLDLAMEIAGGHHERWDGTGYPRGLRGEAIPLSARIVAVADVFDALMSKRVYKPAMPLEDVERIIEQGSGTHFDPDVVTAFFAASDELLSIRRRLMDLDEPMSLAPHRGVRGANEDEVSASLSRPPVRRAG